MTDLEATDADALDDAGRRLLLLSALAKRVAGAIERTKADLLRRMPAGAQLRPTLPDGTTQAGLVFRATGRISAAVTDEAALVAWLKSNGYAEHVEFVQRPRAAALRRLLDMAEAAGVPIGPGGEVAENAPAGIAVHESAGSGVVARPDHARAGELWAAARDDIPALMGDTE